MGLRGLVRSTAARFADRLAMRIAAAAHQADQVEIERLRSELARLRSDVEAELALIRAEEAGREH